MNEWCLNEEYKIRLNLSRLALSVIAQDRVNFGAKSRTQFLNRVFLNTYPQSEASIARQLDQLQEHYATLFANLSLSKQQISNVIFCLLNEKKALLQAQHTNYESAHAPFSHTLSEDAVTAIYAAEQESKFYSVAQYFKAIIEDYCRQSLSRREELYFADHFATIRSAIENGNQLAVCNSKNVRYLVHPYKIMTDPQGTAHYLVCYARTPKQDQDQKTPCSLRICHLNSVRSLGAKAFLSEEKRKYLDTAIHEQGVQFLVGTSKQIRVRLTPRGVQKLNRYSTLRPPQCCAPEDDIYTFNCTETQAEYYFLKLGEDVQILSPKRLRTRFARLHTRAAAAYTDDPA